MRVTLYAYLACTFRVDEVNPKANETQMNSEQRDGKGKRARLYIYVDDM